MRAATIGLLALAVAAALVVAGSSTAAAQGVEKGPPIPPEPLPAGAPLPGSFGLEPVTAADPGGGPPWGLGTFTTDRGRSCTVHGRLVDGELGMLDLGGVFHAFQLGAGPVICRDPGDSYHQEVTVAIGDPGRCEVFVVPGLPGQPCPREQLRTLRSAILGQGLIGADVRTATGWQPLPLSPRGAFIHVHHGTFTDATMPDIRVRAHACGSQRRPDLLRQPRARRDGCTITLYLPHDKPALESARSRRNRRAPRLSIPIDVKPVRGRYRLAFRYPITVQDLDEGYGLRIHGPMGRRCRIGTSDTGKGFASSYDNVEGRRAFVRVTPPRDARRWCPGRHRVQLLFVERDWVVRHRRLVAETDVKVVGEARFDVPPRR